MLEYWIWATLPAGTRKTEWKEFKKAHKEEQYTVTPKTSEHLLAMRTAKHFLHLGCQSKCYPYQQLGHFPETTPTNKLREITAKHEAHNYKEKQSLPKPQSLSSAHSSKHPSLTRWTAAAHFPAI